MGSMLPTTGLGLRHTLSLPWHPQQVGNMNPLISSESGTSRKEDKKPAFVLTFVISAGTC